MNDHLVQAQVLINELTVEAEKLEDVIRAALKGVEGLQEENKQKANQLTQWFSLFAGMFGSFRTQTFAGRYTIPTAAQKAAANLITSFAALGGRDELDSDPAVEKLRNTIQTSRLGTVENIAAQSKLKDIFAARDQIAKAQWAYKIYEEFGNKAQMNAVNRQAEEARQKLESMEVDKFHYEAGKDLSVYFKQPAVQACDYDPSITTQNVPLLQNEEYLLLLRLAMEKTPAGENAKSQLEAKRLEIEEAERQLALDAETGKKTYNFDEYTKTLWGNTWVLSKNGKTDREAAQASMAYNEAIKNGEIKSYQENVPVDYLTEQILAAKNGTNYWTGEKISKLQAYGIIVSSLITTFQGIESFRGSLKRNLPLHPGANEIPASRVKQPKVSVPEVTVPKPVEPVGKIAEGTGEGVKAGNGATFEGKAGRDYSRFAIDDPSPANVKNAENYFKMTRNGDAVEPYEWGLIFDKNGNPISKPITDYHSGKIDISTYKDSCKDGVYTHNHPNNGVFSWQDLETARGFDMAEIRATLPNGTTLSIKRGPKGWIWDNMDTQITLNRAKQNVLTKPEYAELLKQRDQPALDMAWMKEFAELMGGNFHVYK
ncbi:hypothetical protein [Paenibacillus sp. P32E]|uniref:hypothetical protein n=1 Tax=Paenibacillus sp. P32E TaxID=1349434 RepID=UPI002115D090|nr:hypothetical protein [Paenibacillus sp. P32E]